LYSSSFSWPVTNGEAGVEVAVRHGNAGVGRGGQGSGDAGDNLERHARGCERFALLPAPAEDEGVAALEAHDALARAPVLDQQRVDAVLRHGVGGGLLADVDRLHVRAAVGQKLGVSEVVVNDDIRCGQ
jgi:hypothetical protein